MSLELMSIILIGGLVILLFTGLEVYAAVGIVAAIGLLFLVGQPLTQFPSTCFVFMNSFVLTAVPLFIFMGTIFSNTGVVGRLFTAADKWVGGLPGGIASSVIGANAIFGAMSGSSLAATATFGKIAFPDMERLGYNHRLALGSIAAGGILSAAIPPSCILIIYGAWVNASVPRLFAGVLIPGIILALLLVITVMVQVKLNPSLAPKPPKSTWKEKLSSTMGLLPFIIVIVIVLGVIFTGIMTPTEAASMGAFLSIVISLAYRRMTFAAFKESMWTTVKITSMVAFLMVTAVVLGQVFLHLGITKLFTAFMLGLPFGKYGILAVIAIMYLIAGMLIEDWPLLLLTVPFVLPVVQGLGYPVIWFGIWYVMVGEVGLITPPFGMNLFVLHGVVPKYDVIEIALGALPFVIPFLIVGALLVVFPEIATWLPHLIYA